MEMMVEHTGGPSERMQRFIFGSFLLDLRVGTLSQDGTPIAVSHRGLLLLSALTREPGKVLTKSDLMDAAWPGLTVEEGNLTVQIATLRKQLGAKPGGGEWIVTIPRIGYRFITDQDAVAPAPRSAGVGPNKPSLAVLPFDNMSGDPEQEYFADGVVEDILTALSRFSSFAVIARNSSFVYKGRAVDVRQIGRELGVRYVLEGSVRRSGSRLRTTAQLIDAISGSHIWADRFDGSLDEVFDVQDRITSSVATIVEPRIRDAEITTSRRERPESVEAYDLYLQALPLHRTGTLNDNAAAYHLLSKAVELEPKNSVFLAWALDTLLHRTIMGWPMLTTDDRATVKEYVHRALFNAHDDAAVLGRCGNALIQITREYELGLATLKRALRANPNSVEVMTFAGIGYLHCGSVEEARECFHGVILLSPNDPYAFIALTGIAHAEIICGNFDAARIIAEQSFAVSTGFDPTYWMLISANAHLGRLKEARSWLSRYRVLSPDTTLGRIRAAQPPDPARMGAILEGLERAGLPE